jgi:hypothetical protein
MINSEKLTAPMYEAAKHLLDPQDIVADAELSQYLMALTPDERTLFWSVFEWNLNFERQSKELTRKGGAPTYEPSFYGQQQGLGRMISETPAIPKVKPPRESRTNLLSNN